MDDETTTVRQWSEMVRWLTFLGGYLEAWGDAGGDRSVTDLAQRADVAYKRWLAAVRRPDAS